MHENVYLVNVIIKLYLECQENYVGNSTFNLVPEQITTEPAISERENIEYEASITLPSHSVMEEINRHRKISKTLNVNEIDIISTCNQEQVQQEKLDDDMASSLHLDIKEFLKKCNILDNQKNNTIQITNSYSNSLQPYFVQSSSSCSPTYGVEQQINLQPSSTRKSFSPTTNMMDQSDNADFNYLNLQTLDPMELYMAFKDQSCISQAQRNTIENFKQKHAGFMEFLQKHQRTIKQNSKEQINKSRAFLISLRNELQAQLSQILRTQKQKEAAEDGWEYVDQ